MNIKKGDKVKYIGTHLPQHTNKIMEVDYFLYGGVVLKFQEKDIRHISLNDKGDWRVASMICELDEIEEVAE